jgi:DNA-binding MarR family transcriptional regulator
MAQSPILAGDDSGSAAVAGSTSAALADAVRAIALVSRVLEGASGGLSLADYRVLAAIAAGDRRASHLVSRLALGKSTISSAVESLTKRGLLVRAIAEDDNRVISLSLSPDGIRLFERAEGRMARQLELLCDRTPDGLQVIRSLSSLGEALETVAAERMTREDSAGVSRV